MMMNHFGIEILCCDDQCITNTTSGQDQKKDCNGQDCNPFQSCGTCALLCIALPVTLNPTSAIYTEPKFSYQSPTYFILTTDFWQPPEFV